MIDHVIMFKSEHIDADTEATLFSRLAELREIPGVLGFALGKNFGDRSRGFDYCMRVTLATKVDLDRYQEHPIHLDVVAYNRTVTDEHICVDFEWSETPSGAPAPE